MITISEDGARWLAGLLDGFGEIGLTSGKSPAPIVKFKTAYIDRLFAIQKVVGHEGPRARPFKISGDSKMPQHILTFRGEDVAMLENALVARMKTSKRFMFAQRRAQQRAAQKERGQTGPKFVTHRDDDTDE